LIDRIAYGEVIDFIDIHLWGGYTWPTFNLADSFIVCGVAILVAEIFTQGGEEPSASSGDKEDAAGSRLPSRSES
jgi:signal peptidase II